MSVQAGRSVRHDRVTLVHRHLERHGPGGESLRTGLDGLDGWPLYLGRFAALAQTMPDAS